MEITGTIKLIEETQTFDSGFTKRGFVVTTDDDYPQDLYMEFVKDKVSILDEYSAGNNVTVDINLRGREYNGKYYVNITAWKIKNMGEVTVVKKKDKEAEANYSDNKQRLAQEQQDDLPF